MTTYALSRLLQLSSPTLPVGAYSYSQGLEWAAESGAIRDEADAGDWIEQVLQSSMARFEAPMLARVMDAAATAAWAQVADLNAAFVAGRESSELRNETVQMGHSLRVLLRALPDFPAPTRAALETIADVSFPVAWGCAAAAWGIPPQAALVAYVWAWAENQVMAAVKIVPLGQAAGQRLLLRLGAAAEVAADRALALEESEWCNFAPGLALASCRHETQYTRLFRS